MQPTSQIIAQLRRHIAELPSELQGYSAGSALHTLMESWEDALFDECSDLLVSDIDEVITHLKAFKLEALQCLPHVNGGLAGIPTSEWESRLESLGVHIVASDRQYWIFKDALKQGPFELKEEAIWKAVGEYLTDMTPADKAKLLAREYSWSEVELQHALENIENEYGDHECVTTLANGRELRTPAYPDSCDYVRVTQGGFELAYWTAEEWQDDPSVVMGAIAGVLHGKY